MNRPDHAGRLRNSSLHLSALTDDELDDIYLGALEVLERAGIKVESEDCIDVLADAGCKVDREAHVVRMPPEIVEDSLRTSPSRVRLCGLDPRHDLIWEAGRPTFTNFCTGIETVDIDTGQVRHSTEKDVGDIARVTDELEELDFTTVAVTSRDAPFATGQVHGMDAAIRNTTKGIMIGLDSTHETEAVIEMAAAVVGGRDEFLELPRVGEHDLVHVRLDEARDRERVAGRLQ